MDPLATLLMLADAASEADRREYRESMRAWIQAGGYRVLAADLVARGISLQRIVAWKRNGWVAP